jgi:hypothetical protein
MSYCELVDVKDTLLKVQESDIAEATDYVDSLAKSLGAISIMSPTPYEVKQLAIAYACMVRAKYMVGKAPKGDSEDTYERKRKTYMADVSYWENKITTELLTGRMQARRKFPISTPIFRG